MSCDKLNEQNETSDDEVDEYKEENEAPEYDGEDFLWFST